jgi:lysophospholipase L1-like esterase
MNTSIVKMINERKQAKDVIRILGFGSSNTDHFQSGMHWFDCLDLALCHTHGRIHRSINTGIGGHTASDLLARFDEDAARYAPHLAIITIGGNDSNPAKNQTAPQFEANLRELHRRFQEMGCAVMFQTYYSPDPDQCGDLEPFYTYMDIVRAVAADTGSGLVDHLARWEPFRKAHTARYKHMMRDGFHVNRHGNMVMGLDLADVFGLHVGEDAPDYWAYARENQRLMNECQC